MHLHIHSIQLANCDDEAPLVTATEALDFDRIDKYKQCLHSRPAARVQRHMEPNIGTPEVTEDL